MLSIVLPKEIGFHFESGLSESGKSVFHIHEFSKPGIDNRQKKLADDSEEFHVIDNISKM